jgi:hypothetical protein
MQLYKWSAVAPLVGMGLLFGATAHAKLNKERGNIVSTDWNKMEMVIRDPKDRQGTWQVMRDCEVKFTDQREKFPNPKLSDLKAPMYVHFIFEEGSNLIQSIEVVEVGFDAEKGGPGVEQKAVVTNLDMNIGHIEVEMQPGGRKTFEVEPKSLLADVQRGDNVVLRIDRREGGREVVTKITRETQGAPVRRRRP